MSSFGFHIPASDGVQAHIEAVLPDFMVERIAAAVRAPDPALQAHADAMRDALQVLIFCIDALGGVPGSDAELALETSRATLAAYQASKP